MEKNTCRIKVKKLIFLLWKINRQWLRLWCTCLTRVSRASLEIKENNNTILLYNWLFCLLQFQPECFVTMKCLNSKTKCVRNFCYLLRIMISNIFRAQVDDYKINILFKTLDEFQKWLWRSEGGTNSEILTD